jgi:hypothetical protein
MRFIAMKKYLINGALALFAGAFVVGCAEKESDFVPLAEQKAKAFEEVFKEVYGEIDPYQRWGFTDHMVLANGDSVEATVIDEIPVKALTRGDQMPKAFSRVNPKPTPPTFRDTYPVSNKPTVSSSYKNKLEDAITAGAKYAMDYQNYK